MSFSSALFASVQLDGPQQQVNYLALPSVGIHLSVLLKSTASELSLLRRAPSKEAVNTIF